MYSCVEFSAVFFSGSLSSMYCCGLRSCQEVVGCGTHWGDCIQCSTPLVLSFARAPVRMATRATGWFDLGGGAAVRTDWLSHGTPWLARDRNHNGIIDDGFVSAVTSCGVGACTSFGRTVCANGHVSDSCAPGLAAADDATAAHHDAQIGKFL